MTNNGSLRGVKALLFDVFGTVVNWEASICSQLEVRCKKDGLGSSGIDLLEFTRLWRGGYMRRTFAIYTEKYEEDSRPIDLSKDERYHKLLDELLQEPKYEKLAKKWDSSKRAEIVQYWHKLDGWPDSSEGLKALHELPSGLLVGTLSNGSARLLVDVARHADLRWDVIFSGDLLKSYKPNEAMYVGACKLLDLRTDEVAMVAAHIFDCRAAASFGLKTVYVPRETEDKNVEGFAGRDTVKPKSDGGEVDAVVRSLKDLPALFDQAEA